MPRAITHLFVGISSGAMASLVEQGFFNPANALPIKWLRVLRSGVIAGVAALLPDFLEPATSPRHRRFFHSFFVAGLIIWVMKKLLTGAPNDERSDAVAALTGYASHLAADALTPRSLPFV